VTQDQQLLSSLNSTLSKKVLDQITSCDTAEQVWTVVHEMYASQSRARVMHLRTKLASTRKGDMSMTIYFAKMKEYIDEMAASDKKLDDDDVVSYMLTRLDIEYNGLVENVSAKTDPISISDLFAQLLTTEARILNQTQAQMSANTAARGGGSFRGRGGRGYRGGFGRMYGCGRGTDDMLTYQIYEKVGHSAGWCWKRFDREFK
jgi:hypothetical protein